MRWVLRRKRAEREGIPERWQGSGTTTPSLISMVIQFATCLSVAVVHNIVAVHRQHCMSFIIVVVRHQQQNDFLSVVV